MIKNFGRRYVQPTTGGSGPSPVGRLFGMMNTMNQAQLSMHLAEHHAAVNVGAKVVGQKMMAEQALEHAKTVHDTIHETYGPDHPDVLSGKKAAGQPRYPGMLLYGMPENTQNMAWSSRAGAAEVYARKMLEDGGAAKFGPNFMGFNDQQQTTPPQQKPEAQQQEPDSSQEQARETAESVAPKVVNNTDTSNYTSDVKARTGQVYTGPKPPKVG